MMRQIPGSEEIRECGNNVDGSGIEVAVIAVMVIQVVQERRVEGDGWTAVAICGGGRGGGTGD